MKRWLILLLALAFVLTGCKKTDEVASGQTPEPEASATAAQATEEPTPCPTKTPSPAPTPAPEDPIAIDASLYSPDGCFFPLLETEDYTISISFSKRYSGGAEVLLWGDNHTNTTIDVYLSNFVLNDSIQMNNHELIYLSDPGLNVTSVSTLFKSICGLIGFENIFSLSATVQTANKDWSLSDPIACRIAFPEGNWLHFGYTEYLDMRADRQVIRQDDAVTIALLGCGRFLDYSSKDQLTGVLWIENHGRESIPVGIANVSVNGSSLEQYSYGETSIPPGSSILAQFSIKESEFATAGITSIASLDLQILTSEAENSGGRFRNGGSWYPVALAMAGDPNQLPGGETIVFDDGLLKIGLIRTEVEIIENEYSDKSPYAAVKYVVSVENLRKEGISLDFLDPMIDGEPYLNYKWDSSYVISSNNQFGPESRGIMVLTLYLAPEAVSEHVPEFSFAPRVLSQGMDSILQTTADRIVLADNKQ